MIISIVFQEKMSRLTYLITVLLENIASVLVRFMCSLCKKPSQLFPAVSRYVARIVSCEQLCIKMKRVHSSVVTLGFGCCLESPALDLT